MQTLIFNMQNRYTEMCGGFFFIKITTTPVRDVQNKKYLQPL